ncbi:MAG: thrombospondin type 3 repeat-containing protein, partial [Pseudomonadales bacterium]
DATDAFPLNAAETTDTDADGIGDNADNCAQVSNATQVDTDTDTLGDACDDDDDGDGVLDTADAFPLDASESVDTDGDGVGDNTDAFPQDATETKDSDSDGVGDNADVFPLDASEQLDTDGDSVGNNADTDDDGDDVSDAQEALDGTDPLDRYDCDGCFDFDIDMDGNTAALTDGLLVLRHLFGFAGSTLTDGAVGSSATRSDADTIASYLDTNSGHVDIDGNGSVAALTDGLLLLRYLFGFDGATLIEGAVAADATRTTAEAIKTYIQARIATGS